MNDTTNVVASTVAQTIQALAPGVIAAAVGSSGSATGVAVALSLIQAAMQMQQAGQMTPDELVGLFASISSGIEDTHAKWAALNAAEGVDQPVVAAQAAAAPKAA